MKRRLTPDIDTMSPYRPWVLWVALSMTTTAIIVAQSSSTLAPNWRLVWLVMALVALALWLKTNIKLLAYVLLGVSLGGTLMHERMLSWQQHTIPDIWLNTSFTAEVLVDGLAKPTTKGWTVSAQVRDAPSPALTNAQVLLTFPPRVEPLAGQLWSVEMRLYEVAGRYNPAGIDFAAWLFAQNIQATGNVLTLHATTPNAQQWHWQSWRWLAMQKLLSVLPSESAFTGLSVALVLGEVAGVTAEQWRVLRDTGTLHMAVVSGTHISLIAGLAWFLGLVLWKLMPSERVPAALFASVVATLAATAFALLAGMNVPVQRALIMFLIVMLAVWLKRDLHPVLTLSWALIAVLLWDVSAVMQVGFWLSFIATAILLWMLRLQTGHIQRLLLLHIGMSLLLAPFLVLFFQQIPTYSALANLLTAPMIEWMLVPLLLTIALLAWFLPSLATYLASLTDSLWSWVWSILSEIATWPMAVLILSPSTWFNALPANSQQLTVLDMGANEVVVIWQTPEANWLIGSGRLQGKTHSMESLILPSLTALGVNRLSGIVLTESGAQAEQGLAILRDRIEVGQVVSTEQCLQDETTSALIKASFQGWRSGKGDCWLLMNTDHKLAPFALSWKTPKEGDWPEAMPIIAPAPIDKPSAITGIPLWISAGKPFRLGWAQQQFATQQQGAMRWKINETGFQLISAYRPMQQRFYHQELE